MKQILTLIFILFSIVAYSQNGTIRGSVIDDSNGEPVIGANVIIKEESAGAPKGAATDIDGKFSIKLEPGSYDLQISYLGYDRLVIEDVEVNADKVTLLENVRIVESSQELEEVVVTAKAIRTSEAALLSLKRKAPSMIDGISSSRFKLTGDGTAVEAAKRVTGVSVEDGKYVYVRGLGDRYSKTTLNGIDIPGLDPDKNTLQMDIFPTNLIDNIVVSKNFTADMPADFTGGMLNVEIKDFPDDKTLNLSLGASYNPDMHFNSNYLTYEGGDTDWLGFDDGSRELPDRARQKDIPTPVSGAGDQEVFDFVRSFGSELAVMRRNSGMDFSAGISYGNQLDLGVNPSGTNSKLGYIFSLSYKSDYKFYDDLIYGEYQLQMDPDEFDLRQATLQTGALGKRNVLIGALAGLAYKNNLSKYRITAMRLQNGESRAGKFIIENNGEAVGQSGYIADSDNLEYNERSLTNILLSGDHILGETDWEVNWSLSPTFSTNDDPDIRKTAFTLTPLDTFFSAGAGGNPSRIWRALDEVNAVGKLDVSKEYGLFQRDAKIKFGAAHTYKQRDYEILFFDVQFFGSQNWEDPDPALVLNPEFIYPNYPNRIYYQSGNPDPNPNAYESNVNNTAFYISNEFYPSPELKAIVGVRAENYVQRHTGRDQAFASGDPDGRNLDDEIVLESFDLFPSLNLIYELDVDQNFRASYSGTIARPSFKELSFAQILDPISNRIFNGALFTFDNWDGNLSETRIDNVDLRWEYFMERGQIFSISGFYKRFDKPIELVRIPEQQTSTEYQPRNVGDGLVYGAEVEIRRNLDFISGNLEDFSISGNLTLIESQIDMTATEFNSRKNFEKTGQNVDDTRDMAGQAPYVINGGLTYGNVDAGLDIGLFYNVKGRTLNIVGAGLFPDIYVEPFHSVNLSIIKKLGADQNTTIDFKIGNLLDERSETVYEAFNAENQPFEIFNPGRSFSLGLSHRFH